MQFQNIFEIKKKYIKSCLYKWVILEVRTHNISAEVGWKYMYAVDILKVLSDLWIHSNNKI